MFKPIPYMRQTKKHYNERAAREILAAKIEKVAKISDAIVAKDNPTDDEWDTFFTVVDELNKLIEDTSGGIKQ